MTGRATPDRAAEALGGNASPPITSQGVRNGFYREQATYRLLFERSDALDLESRRLSEEARKCRQLGKSILLRSFWAGVAELDEQEVMQ